MVDISGLELSQLSWETSRWCMNKTDLQISYFRHSVCKVDGLKICTHCLVWLKLFLVLSYICISIILQPNPKLLPDPKLQPKPICNPNHNWIWKIKLNPNWKWNWTEQKWIEIAFKIVWGWKTCKTKSKTEMPTPNFKNSLIELYYLHFTFSYFYLRHLRVSSLMLVSFCCKM